MTASLPPLDEEGNVTTTVALATRTVLRVDDEKDVRNVLALRLRRAGYCVLEAAGAGEA